MSIHTAHVDVYILSKVEGSQADTVRHQLQGLNGDDVDFESTWKTLASSFREIHTKNASKLSYEELYRHAYRIVLKKKGEVLYKRVTDFEREWLSQEVCARIQGLLSSSLVSNSEAGLAGTTNNERRVAGEKFLKGLRQAWQDHQLCMNMLADVLMYMDRVYCTDQNQPSIFVTCMGLFRDHILRSHASLGDESLTTLNILNRIILEQIRMERDGDIIDKHLIKSCIYMLEGLYESSQEDENERLYNTSFEEDFLRASREFYHAEGETLLRESDAGTYCRHTRSRITEEQDRCRSTLSEATTPKIEKVVEEELIQNKIHDLIEMESGVRYMVDNDRLEELGLIYDLNARVDPKKAELTKAIQKRVIEMGTEVNKAAIAASQASQAPSAEAKDDKAKAPTEKAVNQQTAAAIVWVEEVLVLKDKFDGIWKTAFESDQPLQTALTRSFTDFINSSTFTRGSEYISLFIDENMKKGIKGKTEHEIDIVLDKAITLLRYIQDKDMFERYYKKHLCRRLLMNKSLSNDVEKQMISRMKIELGNNFTLKLEAMFKDMTISEELTAGYKAHVESLGAPDPKRIELGINVLTSMTWPLETMGNLAESDEAKMECVYPPAIERIKKGFEKFYAEKHSGRMLTWQPNMGTADIRATFPKLSGKEGSRERKYELNVSTYAMVVLLLFNDLPEGGSLSFEEIQARTNIPSHELIRNLQSLAIAPKTRILLKEPMSKDVKPTDRFTFNGSFQSKFLKLKVGVVSAGNKVESDRERRETEKKNDDSRSFCVEAAVVRIMKYVLPLHHPHPPGGGNRLRHGALLTRAPPRAGNAKSCRTSSS